MNRFGMRRGRYVTGGNVRKPDSGLDRAELGTIFLFTIPATLVSLMLLILHFFPATWLPVPWNIYLTAVQAGLGAGG